MSLRNEHRRQFGDAQRTAARRSSNPEKA
jgi:hypothetical protein